MQVPTHKCVRECVCTCGMVHTMLVGATPVHAHARACAGVCARAPLSSLAHACARAYAPSTVLEVGYVAMLGCASELSVPAAVGLYVAAATASAAAFPAVYAAVGTRAAFDPVEVVKGMDHAFSLMRSKLYTRAHG